MASVPMTVKGQRAFIVRPKGESPENNIAPIQMGESDLGAKQKEDGRGSAAAGWHQRPRAIRRKEAGERSRSSNMREIVHIQAGQCGNQIGAKVIFCLLRVELFT